MSIPVILGRLAGGVGLLLLGISLMNDGLKLAAGPALERILRPAASTRWRGLGFGAFVTALVQSSTATTVALIGFVNAGVLNLSQAVWIVFGANIGCTMTGWLVALVGLQFDIKTLALPLVGVGMMLRLTGAGTRRGFVGMTLAGLGLLFFGIDMLRDAFTELPAGFAVPDGQNWTAVLAQVFAGMVMTVLMQSSAAALTVALTAAEGGLLDIQGAAAVVIGANIGTTAAASIAAIGATANARRVAASHVLFNVITAVVALALLPWMLRAIVAAGHWMGLGAAPAPTLALYHTAFNVLGVILIWPLANRLIAFLQRRFRAADDDAARLQYLDQTVLAVPEIALATLDRELHALGQRSQQLLLATLADPRAPAQGDNELRRIERIGDAITDFIARLSRSALSEESAQRLPRMLGVVRHYESAARFALEATRALDEPAARHGGLVLGYQALRAAAEERLARIAPRGAMPAPAPGETGSDYDATGTEARERGAGGSEASGDEALESEMREDGTSEFAAAYDRFKSRLLASGLQGDLSLATMECWLRTASALRRALDESARAFHILNEASPAAASLTTSNP